MYALSRQITEPADAIEGMFPIFGTLQCFRIRPVSIRWDTKNKSTMTTRPQKVHRTEFDDVGYMGLTPLAGDSDSWAQLHTLCGRIS